MVHLVPGSGHTIRTPGAVEIGLYWELSGVLLIEGIQLPGQISVREIDPAACEGKI
jgi:hypothetical protein